MCGERQRRTTTSGIETRTTLPIRLWTNPRPSRSGIHPPSRDRRDPTSFGSDEHLKLLGAPGAPSDAATGEGTR